MRLPLQHAPPGLPPPRSRCEYLLRLARAAEGLPLAPAAELLASKRSRGRHGNALQWHLGLEGHDARSEPDWEGRIEIKLLTLWRSGARLGCDKLKVCDVGVDPWAKLANVLFVFADRLTRMVVGHRLVHAVDGAWAELVRAWDVDPHFGGPSLFVESREQLDGMSPAYYVSAQWLLANVVPRDVAGVFDAPRRAAHAGDPVLTIAAGEPTRCPRCGAPVRYDPGALEQRGCAEAHHGLPLGIGCGARAHVVVAPGQLAPPAIGSVLGQHAALQGLLAPDRVPRLADLVVEPEDHAHE